MPSGARVGAAPKRSVSMAARRLLLGAVAGSLATVIMSAVMFATKRLGLMGEMPPEKITAHLLDRAGWRRRGRRSQDFVSAMTHMGFGTAAGAAFAFVERGPQPPIPFLPGGVAFGAAVWWVSYHGWVPGLGIMPPPGRDRPGRPQAMLIAHLVFGAVLGGILQAVTSVEPAPSSGRARLARERLIEKL